MGLLTMYSLGRIYFVRTSPCENKLQPSIVERLTYSKRCMIETGRIFYIYIFYSISKNDGHTHIYWITYVSNAPSRNDLWPFESSQSCRLTPWTVLCVNKHESNSSRQNTVMCWWHVIGGLYIFIPRIIRSFRCMASHCN